MPRYRENGVAHRKSTTASSYESTRRYIFLLFSVWPLVPSFLMAGACLFSHFQCIAFCGALQTKNIHSKFKKKTIHPYKHFVDVGCWMLSSRHKHVFSSVCYCVCISNPLNLKLTFYFLFFFLYVLHHNCAQQVVIVVGIKIVHTSYWFISNLLDRTCGHVWIKLYLIFYYVA